MIRNSFTQQDRGSVRYFEYGVLTNTRSNAIQISTLVDNVSTTSGHKPTPLVPNNHSYRIAKYDYWAGYRVGNSGISRREGYLELGTSLLDLHNQGMNIPLNRLRNDALEKLNEKVVNSQLNLTVSLAEYGQLIQLLRGFTPKRIAENGLRALKAIFNNPKGSFVDSSGQKRAKHTARSLYNSRLKSAQNRANAASLRISVETAADAWLQYQYGIRPTLADLYGIIDVLYHREINRFGLIEAVAYEELPARFQFKEPNGPRPNRWFVYTSEVKGRVLVKYVIHFDPSKVNQLASWASLNPASLAWELLPLSFVYDWAINISQFLTLIEAAAQNRASFLSGTRTELIAYDSVSRVDLERPDPEYTGEMFAKGTTRYIDYQRKVLSSYPLPVVPTFEMNLGASQVTSAAALFLQQLKTPWKYVPSPLNSKAPTRRPFIRWDKFTHS